MSLHEYGDDELIRRALAYARRSVKKHKPLWVVVEDVFGLGSTYSHDLCRQYGLDPDTTDCTGSVVQRELGQLFAPIYAARKRDHDR